MNKKINDILSSRNMEGVIMERKENVAAGKKNSRLK
jgi:hypothetical protein